MKEHIAEIVAAYVRTQYHLPDQLPSLIPFSFGAQPSSAGPLEPYWQFFCGFEFFQQEAPLDASTMTRWRKQIGPEGLEEML
jgi:hypothetical protein